MWTWTKKIAPMIDLAVAPLLIPSAVILKSVRRYGIDRLPWCKRLLELIGVFPILDHYHEPLWNGTRLHRSLRDDRILPGLDLNVDEQLHWLRQFTYGDELSALPLEQPPGEVSPRFYYHNGAFESGDAEYFYSMIRARKPARIIEVGAGYSTLIAREAVLTNTVDDARYRCRHICIEPYERPWLESCGVEVIREPVERVDRRLFAELAPDDILFIDSSHVIRPQGDVVAIYLDILPMLNPGVLVHIHDVFTPKDYLTEWVRREVKLWNEQYLLEAFLSHNSTFKIIGAVNYLAHHHAGLLGEKCPVLRSEADRREPGSFWIVKR